MVVSMETKDNSWVVVGRKEGLKSGEKLIWFDKDTDIIFPLYYN